MKTPIEECLEVINEEYKKGHIAMGIKIINLIKKRKWVWNEEKFGSVKHHEMFDSFCYELISEIKRLNKKQK